ESSIPQGSVLGPLLFSIYTADLPISKEVTIATFADDTAIFFFPREEGKMLLRMPSDPHQWVMWESVGCRCHTH
ncbi:hypothetical protein EI035_23965, partial [Escherichia coli]|nr:hypothetical protein [Escherichia coli]